MTITPLALSGSTNGKPIPVVATATPGTLIHTGQASTTLLDVLELTASSIHTADVELTLEWGGVTAAEQKKITVPAKAQVVIPRGAINNSLVVRAFAAVASVINIDGINNRMA